MDLSQALLDMEPVISRLTAGVEAVQLLALGLEQLQAPCPNGLFAVSDYLRDSQAELVIRQPIGQVLGQIRVNMPQGENYAD